MIKFLGISGSLRRAYFNSGLLRTAQEVAPDGMELNIAGGLSVMAHASKKK